MTNIAVFASGNGSNAVNLVKAFNSGSRFRVALCLTDKENAPVIEKMNDLGVPTEFIPRAIWKNEPQAVLDILRAHNIDLIALAGFLSFIDDAILNEYDRRILNIHPSLLPAYGGRGMHGANVHKAVIEAGDSKSGATVHIVTPDIDAGPIVVQRCVTVLPEDTPESLEAKVHAIEYDIYPEAIVKLMSENADSKSDRPVSVDDEWAQKLGVKNDYDPNLRPEAPNPVDPATYQPNSPTTRQPDSPTTQQPMPPTYLVWSVVMLVLFSFIPGIVAVVQSTKVSSRYYAGDIEGSVKASERAQIWIIISFVIGVMTNTLYLPLIIAGMI